MFMHVRRGRVCAAQPFLSMFLLAAFLAVGPAAAQDKYPTFGVHMGAPAELAGPSFAAGAQIGRAGGSPLSMAIARYEQQWIQHQKKIRLDIEVYNDFYPNTNCMSNDPGDDGKRLMKITDANPRQRFSIALCAIDNAVRIAVKPEAAMKRGAVTVLAHNVSTKVLHPRDQPQPNYSKWSRSLTGNFHFIYWREDWDDKWNDNSGKPMTKHYTKYHYEAAAGNVVIRAYSDLMEDGRSNPNDIRALVEREVLPNLPVLKGMWKVDQDEAPKAAAAAPAKESEYESKAAVEVQPSVGLYTTDEGLIPATASLPAKIQLKSAKPNSEVEFVLANEAPADFGQGTKVLTVKTTAKGEASAPFWYRGAPESALKGPLEIPLVVRADGRNFKASVHVGLGLSFDKISAPQGEKPRSGANLPFPLMVSVKSVWRPKLDLMAWLNRAEASGVWEGKTIGVRLAGVWLNRPENESQLDVTYDGVTRIVGLREAGRTNFLAARAKPSYRVARFDYPAIVMRTLGAHMYRLGGELQVVDVKTSEVVETKIGERMVIAQTVTMLTWTEPESVLQSLACMLQPQSQQQYLMIEVAKMVPVYGDIADYAQTGTGLLCALMKSDTEKALIDIAAWAGGKVLDHLVSKEVIDGMSTRMQNEVWSAYIAVYGINRYKDKRELAGLPLVAPAKLPPDAPPDTTVVMSVAPAPPAAHSVAPVPPVPPSPAPPQTQDAAKALEEAGKAVGEAVKGLLQNLFR